MKLNKQKEKEILNHSSHNSTTKFLHVATTQVTDQDIYKTSFSVCTEVVFKGPNKHFSLKPKCQEQDNNEEFVD